jgi:hypothetical protein
MVINTVAAGWSVWDNIASATSQVLRVLNTDGTTYKYVQVTYTASVLSFVGWESWNATTHVGTNQTSAAGTLVAAGTNAFSLTASASNAIYLMVTPRRLSIAQGPLWGTNIAIHMCEFGRDTSSLGSAYPVHGVFSTSVVGTASFLDSVYGTSSGNTFAISRMKNPIAAGDLTGTGVTYNFFNMLRFPSTGNASPAANVSTRGFDEATYFNANPIIISGTTGGTNAIILGKVKGGTLYLGPTLPTFTQLDEIVVGGVTHVLMKHYLGAVLFPKE